MYAADFAAGFYDYAGYYKILFTDTDRTASDAVLPIAARFAKLRAYRSR